MLQTNRQYIRTRLWIGAISVVIAVVSVASKLYASSFFFALLELLQHAMVVIVCFDIYGRRERVLFRAALLLLVGDMILRGLLFITRWDGAGVILPVIYFVLHQTVCIVAAACYGKFKRRAYAFALAGVYIALPIIVDFFSQGRFLTPIFLLNALFIFVRHLPVCLMIAFCSGAPRDFRNHPMRVGNINDEMLHWLNHRDSGAIDEAYFIRQKKVLVNRL